MAERLRHVIRQNKKDLRVNLSPPVVQKKSERICRQIAKLDLYRYAKHIALYFAVNGEVDLKSLWSSAPGQGKYCYFPVLEGEALVFLPVFPYTEFEKNRYGIPEPKVSRDKAIALEALDLILMPLVAFDPFGNRLGMGKGYYDKTLSEVKQQNPDKVHLVGVAYEFQKMEALPVQHWDVPLDGIVTEEKEYEIRQHSY